MWKKGEAMFKEGDFIIYGSNGVCQVEHIGSMDLQGVPGDKMYYTLVPVYEEKSRLFTPVDNHKVVMRPVISKQEACDLIDHMQEMQVFEIQNEKNRDTVFKEALKTGDCEELVRVIKTIYEKKQERKAQGKKVTAGDERYFKLAEEHLYGELAIALGIEKDKVGSYIEKRIA
ncbi:MAG: CarD family transcriptional regulator [Lachnospiraceae bacterium]